MKIFSDLGLIAARVQVPRYNRLLAVRSELETVLRKEIGNIDSAMLAGSCARGDDGPLSDIDLWVFAGRSRGLRRRQLLFNGMPLQINVVTADEAIVFMRRAYELGQAWYCPALAEGIHIFGSEPLSILLNEMASQCTNIRSKDLQMALIAKYCHFASLGLHEIVKNLSAASWVMNSSLVTEAFLNVLVLEEGRPLGWQKRRGWEPRDPDYTGYLESLSHGIGARSSSMMIEHGSCFLEKRGVRTWETEKYMVI